MLVMSRRPGETILIGEEIEIVIASIGRSRVKVGIRAPRQMPVIAREEKLVREENLAAAGTSTANLSNLIRRGTIEGQLSRSAGPAGPSPPTNFSRAVHIFPNLAEEVSVRQDAGTTN